VNPQQAEIDALRRQLAAANEALESYKAYDESDRMTIQEHVDVMVFRQTWNTVGIRPARVGIMLARSTVPISHETLLIRLPPVDRKGNDDRETKITNVWVALLRKAMGKDAVINVHGLGYEMPRPWREKVLAVLAAGPKEN